MFNSALVPDTAFNGFSVTASDCLSGEILENIQIWPDELNATFARFNALAANRTQSGRRSNWANYDARVIPIQLQLTGPERPQSTADDKIQGEPNA